ncbi:MAG TPA: hypothetical protein VMX97_03165 [Hyphomicrobiaceae bacterium]|nr:hypothetical protein [Hyphomicrobiaceae bacterium]
MFGLKTEVALISSGHALVHRVAGEMYHSRAVHGLMVKRRWAVQGFFVPGDVNGVRIRAIVLRLGADQRGSILWGRIDGAKEPQAPPVRIALVQMRKALHIVTANRLSSG